MVNYLKIMNGHEVWTNAFGRRFGERVCVGIDYPFVVHDGKRFIPTKTEKKHLWDDFFEKEFGSPSQSRAALEAEFGKSKG